MTINVTPNNTMQLTIMTFPLQNNFLFPWITISLLLFDCYCCCLPLFQTQNLIQVHGLPLKVFIASHIWPTTFSSWSSVSQVLWPALVWAVSSQQLEKTRLFTLFLGIPSTSPWCWVSCFLHLLSSFLVWSLVLVKHILQELSDEGTRKNSIFETSPF